MASLASVASRASRSGYATVNSDGVGLKARPIPGVRYYRAKAVTSASVGDVSAHKVDFRITT
jgi:hypothetical protein